MSHSLIDHLSFRYSPAPATSSNYVFRLSSCWNGREVSIPSRHLNTILRVIFASSLKSAMYDPSP